VRRAPRFTDFPAGFHIPPLFPIPGLGLVSNSQIYPWLLNGNSVMTMAETAATEAARRLSLSS
jgi:hypothetical protein